MAKAEGWTRNTKWRSMPQRMLRARAVSFFGRDYIPDILNGMSSVDEAEAIEADIKVAPSTAEDKLDKVANLLAPKTDPVPVPEPEPVSDVIEPEDAIMAIGSGGSYALAAARALLNNTELDAREIVEKGLTIAGDICVYTNQQQTIEELNFS